MRIILPGTLLLAASALLGCASPSVPSWAVAATGSRYLAEKTVEQERPKMTSGQNSRAEADGRNTGHAKIDTVKVDDLAAAGGALPANDLRRTRSEMDRRQAEENRKIDAALAICRC